MKRPAVPDLCAIFVNHRSAQRCAAAVASLRACLEREGLRGETVVVDCGSGPEEAKPLEEIRADRLILLPDNRGYSGGLNAGIAAAGSARLLLCNADVEFREGSVGPLLRALEDAAAGAAAPVQFADRGARIHLPSGFESRFLLDYRQIRAGGRGEAGRFARRAAAQWRLWREGGEAAHLAGSILATRMDVLNRVGRFDERFAFEYEETEWEDRVRRAGYRLRVVSESTAFHFHGSSSAASPGVAARAAASREEYRRRRYGRIGRAILARARPRAAPAAPAFSGKEIPARGPGFVLAASPNPTVLPFAGVSLESGIALEALFDAVAPKLCLRVFRAEDGKAEEVFWAEKPHPASPSPRGEGVAEGRG